MLSFKDLFDAATEKGEITVAGDGIKYTVRPFNSSLSFTPVSDGGLKKEGKLVGNTEDVSRYTIIGGRRKPRRSGKKSRKARKSRSRKSRKARR
jgi:hypothetical protein